MGAGRFLFPIIMIGVVLFFVGFVASTPAEPASATPEGRALRVRPGDSVLLEVTGYLGEPGKGVAFFSTQEERQAGLPKGVLEPQYQTAPVTYHTDVDPNAKGLDQFLLNHRAGDSFTTPKIPASDAFGDWNQEMDLPRTLAVLPRVVEYDNQTDVGPGQTFEVDDYVHFWSQRGVTLQVGTEWECEGEGLWTCKLLELSRDTNRLSYERLVEPGDTFPVAPLWGNAPVGGNMEWDFSAQPGTDNGTFTLRLDPPVGTLFQFRADASDAFRAGTYEVLSLTNTAIHVRYSATTTSEPELIGQPVYYDIVIVSITRPAA